MNSVKKLILAAALVAPATLVAGGAVAQTGGVAVLDAQAAIGNTKAFTAAIGQIKTTYKTQLDQAEARRQAIGRELQPLVTQFETARAAPNANQATLQSQATAIQTRQQAGERELQQITLPASRAQAYVVEQVQAQLPTAVQNAMRTRNVSVLLRPESVLTAQPAGDLTPAVTAELDRLVPSVNATPPANWQPGQQQAAAGAPAAGAPAATTTPATNTNARRNQGR